MLIHQGHVGCGVQPLRPTLFPSGGDSPGAVIFVDSQVQNSLLERNAEIGKLVDFVLRSADVPLLTLPTDRIHSLSLG
jgi:hypothetical protein